MRSFGEVGVILYNYRLHMTINEPDFSALWRMKNIERITQYEYKIFIYKNKTSLSA